MRAPITGGTGLLGRALVPLVLPLPSGFKFQTVDAAEVAARLVRCLGQGPRGRVGSRLPKIPHQAGGQGDR